MFARKRSKNAAARQARGSPAINVVRPPAPNIYLRLQFVDPENRSRTRLFPVNFAVTVRFGPGTADQHDYAATVQADGKLTFPARPVFGKAWRTFTLLFAPATAQYLVCEAYGAPYNARPALATPTRRRH
jgi:hypothetical protein